MRRINAGKYPGSARASRAGDGALAIADFSEKGYFGEAPKVRAGLALHARRVRSPDYSARSASTGLTKLARRAGNKHASKAASARTDIVAPSRSGLLADT
jgi:hypothetical protein